MMLSWAVLKISHLQVIRIETCTGKVEDYKRSMVVI
jgi:hypothetical protein